MIYVITHKKFDDSICSIPGYQVLHVGQNDHCDKSYLRDDSGENISYKNPIYCELTGLYWIWKNSIEQDNDIVGLSHYRRFFTSKKMLKKYSLFNKMPVPIAIDEFENICDDNTIVLPTPFKENYPLETAYSLNHNIEDLRITRMVIEQLYPEYIYTYDDVLSSDVFYGYNMIVLKNKNLKLYCKWLFDILFAVEDIIKIDDPQHQKHQRVYGFISERLLQVWALHNKYNILEYPVFNTERRPVSFPAFCIKKIRSTALKKKRIRQLDILNPQNKKYHI